MDPATPFEIDPLARTVRESSSYEGIANVACFVLGLPARSSRDEGL